MKEEQEPDGTFIRPLHVQSVMLNDRMKEYVSSFYRLHTCFFTPVFSSPGCLFWVLSRQTVFDDFAPSSIEKITQIQFHNLCLKLVVRLVQKE